MKTYLMLTKPGIILGNAITTLAGFALASGNSFNPALFFATLAGLSLIIAAAGVFNNYIDQHTDAKMGRTQRRPMVTGEINQPQAILFGGILAILGSGILALYTNPLAVAAALLGFFIYLVLYGFLKYRSFYGTLVGSLAGGIPPLVGYCAASGRLDGGAILIFLVLVCWQMPHFYAIAITHMEDYAAGGIPVLPLVKGLEATKVDMLLYTLAFLILALLLPLLGFTGALYTLTAVVLGLIWVAAAFRGLKLEAGQDRNWAKRMFRISILVMMGISLSIPIELYISNHVALG